MKYELLLASAINHFDDSSDESFYKLRDLICEISDEKVSSKDPVMRELLFLASEKMRVFGYNKMNDINEYNDADDNSVESVKYNLIHALYTGKSGILLDRAQKNVIDIYMSRAKKRLFLSAPTSFGKTTILREIIYLNKDKYNNLVLIFPTNALLYENTKELEVFVKKFNLDYKIINNTLEKIDEKNNHIFILTPERFLKLQSDYPEQKIDFFFMDEIYKVDNFFKDKQEDNRDLVFRVVLYILAKKTKDFYLAGPYINIEELDEGFRIFIKKFDIQTVYESRELVKKNIHECWGKKFRIEDNEYRLPTSKTEKVVELINLIFEKNIFPVLIYCGDKNQVLNVAESILANPCIEIKENTRYVEFLSHIQSRYGINFHGKNIMWPISKYLSSGIGIHFGALPKYIQKEMIYLFQSGVIKVIISTTSITEGVNTTARSLIFYGKTKGGKPFKKFDVKNIFGRAGRYYHHFIGDIFILEREVINNIDIDDNLDFISFSEKNLSGIDIDNTDIEDLKQKHHLEKIERETVISKSKLPTDILNKNRTVDFIDQIEIFNQINKVPLGALNDMKESFSSINNFIKNNMLKNIYTILNNVGIVETHELLIYPAICHTYTTPGFNGMLFYELQTQLEGSKNSELSERNIKRAYQKAFTNINNIIEYKVPKHIHLFGYILSFVCEENNIDFDVKWIDTLINFYERGVFTLNGQKLFEKGFPIVTIKELERKYKEVMNLEFENCLEVLIKEDSVRILDDFERRLLCEIKESSFYN